MTPDAFLFDLDGTLIDTAAVASARSRRAWRECVARLGETAPYPGVVPLLGRLRECGRKIAVVTTSVSYYAEHVLRHHRLPYDALVAYHDVRRTKPAPDGYLRALRLMGVPPDRALGVGDQGVDALALRAAGIRCAGAGWNRDLPRDAGWDFVAESADELLHSTRAGSVAAASAAARPG